MYQGNQIEGIEFYNLLFESDDFNIELGKVVLAAGRLESELVLFYHRRACLENFSKKSLGMLIKIGKENNLLEENLYAALDRIRIQRNYLMHNIHSLLIGSIEETILEGRNLLDSDVQTYIERAWQLRNSLSDLAKIIRER